MGKLTAAGIKELRRKPGKHHDGGGGRNDGSGLYLKVVASKVAGRLNRASWVVRVQHNGQRRELGLGPYPGITIAEAREDANKIKNAMLKGEDPHTVERRAKKLKEKARQENDPNAEPKREPVTDQTLFRVAAEDIVTTRYTGKTQQQALSRLRRYAFPALGHFQVKTITADMIAQALKPIWLSKPETALRTRELIGRVLRSSRSDGPQLESSLAKLVSEKLPIQTKGKNFAAMPYQKVPAFVERLKTKPGMAALALRFTILNAVRSGEARLATWDEIDLDARVWTIPAERMKSKREHRVPLSPPAIAVLREAEAFRTTGDYVFPGAKERKPMSDMSLLKVMRDWKLPFVIHGFRSSFRDWAAEKTDYAEEIQEAALAHAVSNAVVRAYRRTTYFDLRRDLMAEWGGYIAGPNTPESAADGKVVPLKAARR